MLVLEQELAWNKRMRRSSISFKDDRIGYEAALAAADRAWDDGDLDFTAMEANLAPLVEAQLDDV